MHLSSNAEIIKRIAIINTKNSKKIIFAIFIIYSASGEAALSSLGALDSSVCEESSMSDEHPHTFTVPASIDRDKSVIKNLFEFAKNSYFFIVISHI